MRGSERFRLVVLAAALVLWGAADLQNASAQAEDPTARLRAALRQATVRVRELEDENATLLAKQAEMDRDKMALTQKAAENEKGLQSLRGQTAARQAALERATQTQAQNLEKWESAYKEAAEAARTRDADAKRLEVVVTQLREQNRLAETKNAELYKLGQEMLTLYDDKGVLQAIGTGEPVTRLMRVRYENIMQDYEDKLRASRVTHPAPQ